MDTKVTKRSSITATYCSLRRVLAAVFVICACCTTSPSLRGGTEERSVAGVVTTIDGSDAPRACISARPVGTSAGNLGCTEADEHGAFTIRLRPGEYIIRAKDEAEGYPDPNFLLASDPSAKFPRVVVGQSDVSGVRVVLGAKGGVLEGIVRDQATGFPIVGAKVTISDAHAPGAYVEVFSNKDGAFQFTVPAKPVVVSAAAMSYESGPTEEVTLTGGRHRSIEINLRKCADRECGYRDVPRKPI
jgi:hypothetical protein